MNLNPFPMYRLLLSFSLVMLSQTILAQKMWQSEGISMVQMDTISDGYECLKGTFIVKNTNPFEVMNMIVDVDNYDWVVGESVSKMHEVDKQDSSFTFDFFVHIPLLFVKKTGRVKVMIKSIPNGFYTLSHQLKNYTPKEGYDQVEYYSASWKVQKHSQNDVMITYTGVYKDQNLMININGIILSRIRKRLMATLENLKTELTQQPPSARKIAWPNNPQQAIQGSPSIQKSN